MNNAAKIRRKHFLIYPRFQLTLIIVNIVIMAGAFGVVALQTARMFGQLRQMGQDASLGKDHVYYQFLEMQSGVFQSHLFIALAVALVVSLSLTLLLSHRLAGPIVRLRSYFDDIALKGRPSGPLQFRSRDYFSDLPPVINQAINRLEHH
ncbi:MAG: hypothetical protein HYV97_19705 [Bdellovibrio sp.]|nr:hypothetical protein [Bdellovibrio sp.]